MKHTDDHVNNPVLRCQEFSTQHVDNGLPTTHDIIKESINITWATVYDTLSIYGGISKHILHVERQLSVGSAVLIDQETCGTVLSIQGFFGRYALVKMAYYTMTFDSPAVREHPHLLAWCHLRDIEISSDRHLEAVVSFHQCPSYMPSIRPPAGMLFSRQHQPAAS